MIDRLEVPCPTQTKYKGTADTATKCRLFEVWSSVRPPYVGIRLRYFIERGKRRQKVVRGGCIGLYWLSIFVPMPSLLFDSRFLISGVWRRSKIRTKTTEKVWEQYLWTFVCAHACMHVPVCCMCLQRLYLFVCVCLCLVCRRRRRRASRA